MRIEVSQLPPASANPNSRAHWTKTWRDNKVYSGAVYFEAVQARNSLPAGTQFSPFKRPVMQLTFVVSYEHEKPDEDNLRAKFKAGQDILVAAGIIERDDMEHLVVNRPIVLVDADRAPLTIIEIEEGK